jgi:hypothetical protein
MSDLAYNINGEGFELPETATGCRAMEPILRRALESGSADDLQAVSQWWASGLYTRQVDPHVARTLVERGATLSVHAAAGIGLTDHLAHMLAGDPTLIDAKGCDACTPLHFSRDIATAQLLLDRGARIDARDEDHDSTPGPMADWERAGRRAFSPRPRCKTGHLPGRCARRSGSRQSSHRR